MKEYVLLIYCNKLMKEYIIFTTRIVNMTEVKKAKQSYSDTEIKEYIFTKLNLYAQDILQQRRCYITKAKAASIVAEYKDIIHFVVSEMRRNVINIYLEVDDTEGFYTDKNVYEVYLFRFIPEFDDLEFKDGSISCLEAEIKDLKEERSRIKYKINSYNSDQRRGPPDLGLDEVTEVIEKYNNLFHYGKIHIDILISKREDIATKVKELLAREEEYLAHLNELNRIKKDLRRCINKIAILKKREQSQS